MKRGNLITVLLAACLLALLVIQYFWIDNAIENESRRFRSEVHGVVTEVILEVEESNYCIDFYSDLFLDPGQRLALTAQDDSLGTLDSVPIMFMNTFGERDSLEEYQSLYIGYPVEMHMNLEVKFLLGEDSLNEAMASDEGVGMGSGFPVLDGLNVELLDSLLAQGLSAAGIDGSFHFAVQNPETGDVVYTNSEGSELKDNGSGHDFVIFSDSRFYQPLDLRIHFPQEQRMILGNLGVVITSSIIVLIILSILFITFIRNLNSQKRLVEMKMDFVNNMTHEFKTPISNIRLAADALSGNVDGESKELLSIIQEENVRLQEGIDLVLSSSLIEGKELKLNMEPTDVHELICRVVQHMQMSFERKGGKIEMDLFAENKRVKLDEMHMINVLNNLLDNALKYCDSVPMVKVSTSDNGEGFVIRVHDNGIGIPENEQVHIFERFHRVSTSDRHENRGFGIGLFYVRLIMDAHGGKVSVESQPGQGSTFSLYFPEG